MQKIDSNSYLPISILVSIIGFGYTRAAQMR